MDNADLDALAVELVRAKKLLQDARYNVEVIEHELLKHMAESGVSEIRTEHYLLTEKNPPVAYVWNDALRAFLNKKRIEGKITKDEIDNIVSLETSMKVKTTTLQRIAARRGFTDELEKYYVKTQRGAPHVDVEEA